MGTTAPMWLNALKALIILFLGARPVGPALEGIPMQQSLAREAPIYAQVDVAGLRQMVSDTPELRELIYGGQEPTRAYDEAAMQLSRVLRTTPVDVKRAFDELRRVGFWMLSFGEDEENFRILLVFDCGGARDLLPGLLRGLDGEHEYAATSYAGVTVHSLASRRLQGVWMAELEGKIALGLDPLIVQEFLLQAKAAPPTPSAPMPKPPLISAQFKGPALVDRFLAVLDGDRDEFLLTACAADFAACRSLKIDFDGRRLVARLELDPSGRYAEALEGPGRPPKLAAAVPENAPLAVLVRLKDPMALYRAIRSAVTDVLAMMNAPDEAHEFFEEFRKETGLDLERDVVANVTEAAYIAGQLKSERDLLNHALLLLETQDAARARTSIETFVTRISRGRRDIEVSEMKGAGVWHVHGTCIALKGNTVVLCGKGNPMLGAVLDCLEGKPSPLAERLRRRHPRASSALVFNPSVLLGFQAEGEPMLAGLHFAEGALTLEAEVNLRSMAQVLSRILQWQAQEARRSQCVHNLRQLSMACAMYVNDRNQLPPDLDGLLDYLGGRQALTCPASGKPYVYRKELAGKKFEEIADPGRTVLAHDPPGAHAAGGCVLYVDGHVRWLDRKAFLREIGQHRRDVIEVAPGKHVP